jgi:hypothetical protein
MTYAPQELRDLGAYWTGQGGVNLGIVGDVNHTAGYHLGRDRIYGPGGSGSQDYSVQHPRDKAGLSGAASAIDLGKLGGTYKGLQDFSAWLVKACQQSSTGHRDVREIIYSPDGQKVQRYSGIDGKIHTGPGNGDASHRSHTHISYFRDSETRDKVELFSRYWEGDDMGLDYYPQGGGDGVVILKPGRGLVNLVTGAAVIVTDAEKNSFARVHLAEPYGDGVGRQDGYLVRHAGQAHVALDDVVQTFTPSVPPAPGDGPAVLTGDDGSEYRRV